MKFAFLYSSIIPFLLLRGVTHYVTRNARYVDPAIAVQCEESEQYIQYQIDETPCFFLSASIVDVSDKGTDKLFAMTATALGVRPSTN